MHKAWTPCKKNVCTYVFLMHRDPPNQPFSEQEMQLAGKRSKAELPELRMEIGNMGILGKAPDGGQKKQNVIKQNKLISHGSKKDGNNE